MCLDFELLVGQKKGRLKATSRTQDSFLTFVDQAINRQNNCVIFR